MDRRLRRTSRAALLSAAVVLLPAAAGVACVGLGTRALGAAVTASDPAGALLGLASLALAGVLAWAGAAAAAGVVEAWTSRRPRPVRVATTVGAGGRVATHSRTGAVSAGVAALVVAALTAPAASAASAAAAPAPTVVSQQVDAGLPGQVPGDGTDPADSADSADSVGRTDGVGSAAATGLPGSWAALGDTGFRAPRGAAVGTAALVTSPPTRQAATTDDAEVVVVSGDTLWTIAARHLGAGAGDDEVAAAWPRWWEANRHTVGPDPDLLLPGQRLVVPAP